MLTRNGKAPYTSGMTLAGSTPGHDKQAATLEVATETVPGKGPIVATLGEGLVCDTYVSRPSQIEMHLDSISWTEAVRNGWLFG
jgi:hypothetical protein